METKTAFLIVNSLSNHTATKTIIVIIDTRPLYRAVLHLLAKKTVDKVKPALGKINARRKLSAEITRIVLASPHPTRYS